MCLLQPASFISPSLSAPLIGACYPIQYNPTPHDIEASQAGSRSPARLQTKLNILVNPLLAYTKFGCHLPGSLITPRTKLIMGQVR